MDSSEIPNHHARLEVCSTRPAYREGRKPTAVKVYTIHHESSYLLVQGVPAVGAGQELSRLFGSFGSVVECRPLDDYPTDTFSEAYLIKFQKIQSARFAKKKLDDYSFFGGNLHVCYAPEYETTQETRHKLNDRRRVIAAKILQHAGQPRPYQRQLPKPLQHGQLPVAARRMEQFDINLSQLESLPLLQERLLLQAESSLAVDVQNRTSSVPVVPSTGIKHPQGNCSQHSRGTDSGTFTVILNQPHEQKTNAGIIRSENIVIKQYNPKNQALKFVPRQASKRQDAELTSTLSSEKDKDELNHAIQKEAFRLCEPQGPALPPSKEEREQLLGHRPFVDPKVEASVNSTVKEIRKRLSKFITESVPKKMKHDDTSAHKERGISKAVKS